MKMKESILIILLSLAPISAFAADSASAIVHFTETIPAKCGITATGDGGLQFADEPNQKGGVNLKIIGNSIGALTLTIPEQSITDLLGNTDTTIEYSFESVTGASLSNVTGGSASFSIQRGEYIIRAKVTNKDIGEFEANSKVEITPLLELNCS
ncbi:hypothetical protein [Aliivibrio sp. SR45-2]|uniref:hypothetical protein n=1 Tax=Aliivibrio sp. SR45-2 TaxID=2760931 RepID=UPI0015F8ED88|nr:hypothetical protein [Aliivibrio sp. SR45-2]MBB1313403.1 hypothetical protein [Aliivibrio sp. SR45-2]